MVALQNGQPVSLIEAGVRKLAAVKARKVKREGPSRLAKVWASLSNVVGTLLALVCFTVAAFAVGFVIGMAVAGISFLLLDFKVSLSRRTHERR